ncbi:hypothetical protein ACIREO_13010 [Streptomyces sp. NPDC102441]|uniref:hypothetical protein n=1 Tax=Streptomyces sp. NPDC102441 TaxID=3366176 RepID=UPI003823D0C5
MHRPSPPGTAHTPRTEGVTPPGVLSLNAYLMYATGKAARRRLTGTLTAAGRRALARLDADVSATESDLLAPLTHEERELFASLLRRVHTHLERGRAADGLTASATEP